MRKRTNDTAKRRAFIIRSLIYGTLGILLFAAAVSSGQLHYTKSLSDLAYIEGRPATFTGFGLVVGLDGTGDGTRLGHTDNSLAATFAHMGIDTCGVAVRTGEVAAVLVQATFSPGTEIGMTTAVHVTALNDATDLSGGRLLPLSMSSRDGRFHGHTSGNARVVRRPANQFAPASGILERELISQTSIFMTEIPEQSFTFEVRGLDSAQIGQVAELINHTFGQIAYAHSGCDIEIQLPGSYTDFAERASLVLQIAALSVDNVVPAYLVARPDTSVPTE